MGAFYSALLCLLIVGISRLLAFTNQGADRGTLLHVPLPEHTVMPDIELVKDGNEGSVVTSYVMDQVIIDYINARDAQARARVTNNTTYLQDHFTDEMVTKWIPHFSENAEKGINEQSSTLAHNIDITFFSLDESVIGFTDRGVVEYHRLYQDETLISSWIDTSDYQVICVLEDARWRIRQIKEIKKNTTIQNDLTQANSLSTSDLKGINYYPAQSPWNLLDAAINDEDYVKDMSRIKELGCNSLKIFLQYEEFGKENVSIEKINHLLHFLDIVHDACLLYTSPSPRDKRQSRMPSSA